MGVTVTSRITIIGTIIIILSMVSHLPRLNNVLQENHLSSYNTSSIIDQTDVSLSLAKHVISKMANDRNLVFSPLSIHAVLSMIASGTTKGPTRDQMLGFLKSRSIEALNSMWSRLVKSAFRDGRRSGGPRMSVINGIWVDKNLPLKPAFKKIVEDDYKADSNQVDFQNKVRREVNTWAEKRTNGQIKEILPQNSVQPSTTLIFANALYFKGSWERKFYSSKTRDYDFFLLNGNTNRVPFMTSTDRQNIRAFSGFKVLELPYKQGVDKREFSMYFFLPDAKDGLSALLDKISTEFGFIDQHRPYEQVKVGKFRIPKFKMEFVFEASEVLKGMGLELPFRRGGLKEMVDSSDGDNLFISQIFHKSFIEVNEGGMEAAAATASILVGSSRNIKEEVKVNFVADHPFVFVLRENTSGVVHFIGQVVDPSTSR